MATAILQKPAEKTGTWAAIFPNEQITETQSALFVKKLLAVAVSNIAYLRAIFPEHAFGDRSLEGLNLKILRDDMSCPGASQVIKWVKGCFDAFDKKYLYVDPEDPDTVIECYTFKFSYLDNGSMDIYRNDEKITEAHSEAETRKATIRLLRTIILLTQTLDSLPDNVMMTMKLLYYDDVTPVDYEPPGFRAVENGNFVFEEESVAIKAGDVNTGTYHQDNKKMEWSKPRNYQLKNNRYFQESQRPSERINQKMQHNELLAHSFKSTVNCEVSTVVKVRVKTDKKQFEMEELKIQEENLEKHSQTEKNTVLNNVHELQTSEKSISQQKEQDTAYEILSNMLNEPFMDANFPTKSPAKPEEAALDQVESLFSQATDIGEEYKVRCPCECNEDDGLMIMCSVCKFWQHGICFLVSDEADAPEQHICDICAELCNKDRQPTDYYLTELSPIQVQATCLWRRTLVACLDLNRILAPVLAKRLGTEITVAQGLINRLAKEGFLKSSGKGKKLGKIIDKEKIRNEGISKYMRKLEKPKVKENHFDKLRETQGAVEEIRFSPKLPYADESKNGALNLQEDKDQKRKDRKRAISMPDEDQEFEISQDVNEDKPKKVKKASVVTKNIMV